MVELTISSITVSVIEIFAVKFIFSMGISAITVITHPPGPFLTDFYLKEEEFFHGTVIHCGFICNLLNLKKIKIEKRRKFSQKIHT